MWLQPETTTLPWRIQCEIILFHDGSEHNRITMKRIQRYVISMVIGVMK